MKDLNSAWEQLRGRAPWGGALASDVARGGEEALDWLLDAVLSTADDHGDAVNDRELRYMLRPVRKVQSVGKLQRWLVRRTPTLLAAMAKGDMADWYACASRLDADGNDSVVMLLLDRCLLG